MKKEKTYYWPLWFSRLLDESEQKKIEKILPKIQTAQIYLWQALNIYDDFLDGEGKPEALPAANKFFRHYLEIFYQFNLPPDYYRLFNIIFDNLDKANIKEASGIKLKIKNGLVTIPKNLPEWSNSQKLSDKSLALSLSALALLSFLGYKISDKKSRATVNFFRYSLAAKQLADDSYDWLDDLKNSRLTIANAPILKAAQKQKIRLNLNKPEIMYLLFAQESSPIIIKEMKNLCRLAKKEMARITKKTNNILLSELILPLEKSCQAAEKFTQSVLEA